MVSNLIRRFGSMRLSPLVDFILERACVRFLWTAAQAQSDNQWEPVMQRYHSDHICYHLTFVAGDVTRSLIL